MKHFVKYIPACLLAACMALPVVAQPQVRVALSSDLEVLPADTRGRAYIKVALLPEELESESDRPPLNVAFVLDRSGSMGGRKIADAKAAILEAARRLDRRDIASLVVYDDQIETVIEASPFPGARAFSIRLAGVEARGTTAIYGGVSQGAAELRRNLDARYVNRIILLSDGIANVGPSAPADFRLLGKALAGEGIVVSTVGLGAGFNEDLMTGLSQASEGNAYFAESSKDLPGIFEREIGTALNLVASVVEVTIELEPGLLPVRVVGREGRIRGQEVRFNVGQLYGGQEKFALIEVEFDPADAGAERKLEARARYQGLDGKRRDSGHSRMSFRYSSDKEAVAAARNQEVAAVVIRNRVAAAQEEAIALADAGRRLEAAEALRATASANAVYARQQALPEPAENGELLDTAEEVETSGMSGNRRKALRYGSYETRTQQGGSFQSAPR